MQLKQIPDPVGGDVSVGAHGRGLNFPEEPPRPGKAIELADGVLWMRLPVAGRLQHVNIYALDDGDEWTLIDCGQQDAASMEALQALLNGPLRRKPVRNLVLTHHHADHAGGTAGLVVQGVRPWASRAAWLHLRMLSLETPGAMLPTRTAFNRWLGMSSEEAAALAAAVKNLTLLAPTPPPGYRRLEEGQALTMGRRSWRVRLGDGHAPEHASFWSEDGSLVIIGDQALPSISASLGVDVHEPHRDTVGDWLSASSRLGALADERRLVLPGHERPYRGLSFRLRQIADKHNAVLARLRSSLEIGPCTAMQTLKQALGDELLQEDSSAAAEVMAHLLHLEKRGEAVSQLGKDGALHFARAS